MENQQRYWRQPSGSLIKQGVIYSVPDPGIGPVQLWQLLRKGGPLSKSRERDASLLSYTTGNIVFKCFKKRDKITECIDLATVTGINPVGETLFEIVTILKTATYQTVTTEERDEWLKTFMQYESRQRFIKFMPFEKLKPYKDTCMKNSNNGSLRSLSSMGSSSKKDKTQSKTLSYPAQINGVELEKAPSKISRRLKDLTGMLNNRSSYSNDESGYCSSSPQSECPLQKPRKTSHPVVSPTLSHKFDFLLPDHQYTEPVKNCGTFDHDLLLGMNHVTSSKRAVLDKNMMASSRTTALDMNMTSSKAAELSLSLTSSIEDLLPGSSFTPTENNVADEERRVTYRSLYRSSTNETLRLSQISSSGLSAGTGSSRSSSYTNEEMMRANHKIVYDSPDELKMQAIEKTRDFWAQHRHNNYNKTNCFCEPISSVSGPGKNAPSSLLPPSSMYFASSTHYRNFSMIKAK